MSGGAHACLNNQSCLVAESWSLVAAKFYTLARWTLGFLFRFESVLDLGHFEIRM